MTDTTTGSATGTARDQAAGVASDARDAGHRVASTAKSEATNVAHEATSQAKQLFEQTGGELREQAAQQQSRAASGLRTVGEQLRSMAQNTDQGVASDVVNQVANRVSSTAGVARCARPGLAAQRGHVVRATAPRCVHRDRCGRRDPGRTTGEEPRSRCERVEHPAISERHRGDTSNDDRSFRYRHGCRVRGWHRGHTNLRRRAGRLADRRAGTRLVQ